MSLIGFVSHISIYGSKLNMPKMQVHYEDRSTEPTKNAALLRNTRLGISSSKFKVFAFADFQTHQQTSILNLGATSFLF